MTFVKKLENNKCWKWGGEKEHSYAIDGSVNRLYGKQHGGSLKNKNKTTIRSTNPTLGYKSGKHENSKLKRYTQGKSQDGGGIGQGDHFLSYKFIERTIERWTKFTKQLISSSRHQAPRKATHCLRREVRQNIKDKKGDKRARDRDPSREGSLNRGSFQSPGNPRAGRSEGSFWISEGNLTGRKN